MREYNVVQLAEELLSRLHAGEGTQLPVLLLHTLARLLLDVAKQRIEAMRKTQGER
jgi:Cft2 family RNA processing exonuclease